MTEGPPVLTLPAQPSSVSAARRFLSSRLAAQHVLDTTVASDAVLVVSELVTNAVLHGREPIVVEVSFADETTMGTPAAVRIVVSDASPVPPAMRDYGDGASTGRGLALIASLSRRWGVEVAEPGKAVWVELDTTSANGVVVPPDVTLPRPSATPIADATAVRFLQVPVDGYLCLQEHNDDILRELELLSFSADDDPDRDAELTAVVERARRFFRTNREGLRREVLAAAARGQRAIDLDSEVSVAVLGPASEMVSVFEDAERLGARGRLLLGPPDPDVVHLRRWFVDELHRQVADGRAPAPYVPLEP